MIHPESPASWFSTVVGFGGVTASALTGPTPGAKIAWTANRDAIKHTARRLEVARRGGDAIEPSPTRLPLTFHPSPCAHHVPQSSTVELALRAGHAQTLDDYDGRFAAIAL